MSDIDTATYICGFRYQYNAIISMERRCFQKLLVIGGKSITYSITLDTLVDKYSAQLCCFVKMYTLVFDNTFRRKIKKTKTTKFCPENDKAAFRAKKAPSPPGHLSYSSLSSQSFFANLFLI